MKTLSRAFTIAFRIGGYLAWLAAWKLGFGGKGSPSRRFAMLLEGQIEHEGLPEFANIHLKAANRVSVALVTLGLYLAASLLMQHSMGPIVGGVPILAVLGYVAAVWYTIRLLRAVGKGL